MGADSNNMLAQLQLQLSQQANQGPNLYGLTAQQDPNVTARMLQKLQNQNYVNSVGNSDSSDLVSLFSQAGKKDFARAGQNIGSMLGINQPPQYNNANTMQQRQAIQDGNAGVTQDLASGVDPEQAKINALTKAAQAGLPGAADALDKAVDAQQKTLTAKAQAFKDQNQGAAAADEISNRATVNARDDKNSSWTTTYTDPNGLFMLQKNGNGETKRVELKPPPNASAVAAQNVTPDAMAAMHQYYQTTGQIPPGIARSPAMAGKFWEYEAQQSGNPAQTAVYGKLANKANGDALDQTTKQIAATTSYFQTMDKNIEQASTLAKQLDFGDVQKLNQAAQAYLSGTSDPKFAKYNVFFDSIANEYAKIKSGSLGNSPVSDSARKEALSVLAPTLGNGGAQAAFAAIKQEGNNRLQSLNDTADMYSTKLGKKAPVAAEPNADAGKTVDFSSLK